MAAGQSKRIETAKAAGSALLLDLDFLAAQTLYDPGLESEVLQLFEEMMGIYFARLETSTTVEDLAVHLHTIRGAAAGVGAFELADQAGAAEAALRAGQPVDPQWVEAVGEAIEAVSAVIAERLRDAAA